MAIEHRACVPITLDLDSDEIGVINKDSERRVTMVELMAYGVMGGLTFVVALVI